MTYLEQLLGGAEVEWKPLGEVAELKRGTSITQNTSTEGCYPVISGGRRPAYYVDQFNRTGETITVAGSGAYAGFLQYWNEPIFVGDAFSIKPDPSLLLTRFVYFFLLRQQQKLHDMKVGGAVPHVYTKFVAPILIPVPPLRVQERIVEILDKFTALEAELEAELEARKKQYEYYRNKLMRFGATDPNVQWCRLGDIGTFVRGNGLQKKDFTETGVPCIHYGQIYTYYGMFATETKSFVSEDAALKFRKAQHGDLIIATTSENMRDLCKTVVWLGKEEICISAHSAVFHHHQNPKYLAFYFQTPWFLRQKEWLAKGTTVMDISVKDLMKIEIPVPPLAVQEQIVAILDKFHTLVHSMSEGLPAEIALRRKQYEYYRNRLLRFPRS